jgi:hypothetical protein
MSEFARDGRRIINPPCEYGHTRQAMECPSCATRVTGEIPSEEWVRWWERRSGRRRIPSEKGEAE